MEFHYRKFNFPDRRNEKPEGFFKRCWRYVFQTFVLAFVMIVEMLWAAIGSAIGFFAIFRFVLVTGLVFGQLVKVFPTGVSLILSLICGAAAAAVPVFISARMGKRRYE